MIKRTFLLAKEFAKKVGITNPMLHYIVNMGYVKKEYLSSFLVFDEQAVSDYYEYRQSVEKLNELGNRRLAKGKTGKYYAHNSRMINKFGYSRESRIK